MFPLGNLKKMRLEILRLKSGYDNLVKKSESYEICFVPDNNYRNFLRKRVEDIDKKVGKGILLMKMVM